MSSGIKEEGFKSGKLDMLRVGEIHLFSKERGRRAVLKRT